MNDNIETTAAIAFATTGAVRLWLGLNAAGHVAQFWLRPPVAHAHAGLRLVEYVCTPALPAAAPVVRTADVLRELAELLPSLRPNYGDVGSRDVDVAARRAKCDRIAELLKTAATPAAPVATREQEAKAEFSYSTNEEEYHGYEDTREAAIQLALSETDDDVTTIWTARNRRFTPPGVADDVIERLQELAYEECGEYAETYLEDVTPTEEADLNSAIAAWVMRVDRSRFFTVAEVQQHDIADLRRGGPAALLEGKEK